MSESSLESSLSNFFISDILDLAFKLPESICLYKIKDNVPININNIIISIDINSLFFNNRFI